MNRRFGSSGVSNSNNVIRSVNPSSIKNILTHTNVEINNNNNNNTFSPQGFYDENISLKVIYSYVLTNFKSQKVKVQDIQKTIDQKKKYLEETVLKMIDIKAIKSEIQKLEKQKSVYLSDEREKEWEERITPLLAEWEEIKKEEGPLKFGQKRKFNQYKMAIVRNFIQISSEYAPLDLIPKTIDIPDICPECRNKYIKEDNKVICEECGIYQDCLINSAEYNDMSRINNSNSSEYQNRETFEKSLTNYQGKQQVNFPSDLKDRFLEYCKANLIRINNLNNENTRPIFRKIGYTNYGDINLFLNLTIGKSLHDLSQWEEILLQDYDMFDQKYNEVKKEDRDSSLGGDYILYILMMRRGIPCDKRDLKLADTPSIRMENDNLARRTFQALGWVFKDTI